MENNQRLDILVSQILGVSREYAKQIILEGKCEVDGKIQKKPGAKYPENSLITLDAIAPNFVSRGGLKLEKAIKNFNLNVENLLCMDIGASTGGFTDCLLQNGAAHVLAVDNGKEQLSPLLTKNPQVVSMENTDIRSLSLEDLPFIPNFIACDVSFISLTHIIPKIVEFLVESSVAVLLIKPQFELGPSRVNKKGVAKNPKDHIVAIKQICDAAAENSLQPVNLDFSPIKGQSGNIEYLILLKKDAKCDNCFNLNVEKIVQEAFDTLR